MSYNNRRNFNRFSRESSGRKDDSKSYDEFLIRNRSRICSTKMDLSSSERNQLFNFQKTSAGLNFKDYSDIPITIKGADKPDVNSFSELKLNPSLAANISECGYEEMTPVQKASLPLGLEGKDMLTCAQTGSGKTAGFLVPLIQRILTSTDPKRHRLSHGHCFMPVAIIMSPTRELAKQIFVQAMKLCHGTGIVPGLVYGGISKGIQMRELRQGGVDILIGTPGRINDFISSGEITLEQAFCLVLDEGDKMLDMGFSDQIDEAIKNGKFPMNPSKVRSQDEKNENRQVLLFSATFPPEIQKLANSYLDQTKACHITVGVIGATNKDVKQIFLETPYQSDKTEKLISLIKEAEKTIKWLVFVNTKRAADDLERTIRDERVARCSSIHGDKSQDARDRVLGMFRSGQVTVLVATDVAARGLDIPDVSCVVNYDLGSNTDDHVHRIGRTGRAGNTGTAYTFIGHSEKKNLFDLVQIMKKDGKEVPEFMEKLAYESRGRVNKFGRGGGFGRRGGRGGGFGGRGGFRGGRGGGFGGRGRGGGFRGGRADFSRRDY